jgi:dolichyl-phosphate beta-glucosyltransferase
MRDTDDPPRLSVVIPCYSEQKNLETGALAEVRDCMVTQSYTWEVLIVDDGSTDDSLALAETFTASVAHFSLHPIPHGTKPAAIREGIEQARGEHVLFADTDQSTPIGELAKPLPWTEEGFGVVIGSRGMGREGFPILRVSLNDLRGHYRDL